MHMYIMYFIIIITIIIIIIIMYLRFLDMHMYITSALQKTDMKAVGLQLALELLHQKVTLDKSICHPIYVYCITCAVKEGPDHGSEDADHRRPAKLGQSLQRYLQQQVHVPPLLVESAN